MAGGPSTDFDWPRTVGASAVTVARANSVGIADDLAGRLQGNSHRLTALFVPAADLFGRTPRTHARGAGWSVTADLATQALTIISVRLSQMSGDREPFAGSELQRRRRGFGGANNAGAAPRRRIDTKFSHSLEYDGAPRFAWPAAQELLSAAARARRKSSIKSSFEEA